MAMTVRNEHGHLIREGIEGHCRCGAPATTEVQVGWFADANNGAGGGQYDEICDACEAADYAPSSTDRDLGKCESCGRAGPIGYPDDSARVLHADVAGRLYCRECWEESVDDADACMPT